MSPPLRAIACAVVFVLGGCDGCRSTSTTVAGSSTALPFVPSTTSSSSPLPTASASTAAEGSASANDGSDAPKVGSAAVTGASKAPGEAPAGYHHVSSFVVSLELANPGSRVMFELVDRVAESAESDAAHRLVALDALGGKEKSEATLSFFAADRADAAGVGSRRVRLSYGGKTAEAELGREHVPSRRCRSSATALKHPVLHPDRWQALMFYAQAADDRGSEARMVEPPEYAVSGKVHVYPEWPEPGLLLRVRIPRL